MPFTRSRLSLILSLILSIAAAGDVVTGETRTSEEIYQQTLRSTAWVKVFQNNKLRKMGTGFLVDRSRKLVVTNQHVVDEQESVEVVFPLYQGGFAVADKKNYIRYDRPIRGWVLATDPKRDLAVIELEVVPHAATAMKLAADSVCPGEHVHLIGNPGTSELLWVYNAGTVHHVSNRKVEDSRHARVLEATVVEIRTRASVKPGYSGGPAVNNSGELVGVATMSNPASKWAWCVDIAEIKDVLRIVRDYPKAARRLLNPRAPADFQDRDAYYRKVGLSDRTVADRSDAILRDSTNHEAYFRRGAAYARRGEWDNAIADYSAALRLAPADNTVVYNRALAYSHKGAFELAQADFEESLRLDPKNVLAHLDQGLLYSRRGAHDLAIADLNQALRLDAQEAPADRTEVPRHEAGQGNREYLEQNGTEPDYTRLLLPDSSQATAYHTLAWVWATCPDAKRRNGKKAVEFARKACELSGWKDGRYLSTLSAAYAECAKFDEAIRWQKQALLLATDNDKATFRARLALYEIRQPLRDR
jgi:tetratricopeptide (TPR) repeat protein